MREIKYQTEVRWFVLMQNRKIEKYREREYASGIERENIHQQQMRWRFGDAEGAGEEGCLRGRRYSRY